MTGINSNTSTDNEFWLFYFPAVVICIVRVVSNVLLLVAFVKDPLKCFRNSGTYLVMNLSVSDCLTSLIGLLSNITVTGRISSQGPRSWGGGGQGGHGSPTFLRRRSF